MTFRIPFRIQRRRRCDYCHRTGWGPIFGVPSGWNKVLKNEISPRWELITCRPCIKRCRFQPDELKYPEQKRLRLVSGE